MRAFLLTAIALACFAGNSLLCRLALAGHHIDAASFTAVRLVSGAAVLAALARTRSGEGTRSWILATALFAYAAPFSFAYLRLGAAMGALILFGAVQTAMLGWAVVRGERPSASGWLGIGVAMSGLVVLTAPGKSAPDPIGAVAMAAAGVAWSVYSLRGRSATGDPVVTTAASFVRSVPFVALLVLVPGQIHASFRGISLAVASGALASGAGYSVWYAALPLLSATRAAVVQLLVPIIAAAGAILLLGEHVSTRLAFASAAIVGGVLLTIRDRSRKKR